MARDPKEAASKRSMCVPEKHVAKVLFLQAGNTTRAGHSATVVLAQAAQLSVCRYGIWHITQD